MKGKEMQEKIDTYLTTKAIHLDHLENKSKLWMWAATFIMEMPVKSSCSHPIKKWHQYTSSVYFNINSNTFALLYNINNIFPNKLFFNQLQLNLVAMS